MKITKKELKEIINEVLNEEASDCVKDYKAGGLSYEDYKACLERYADYDRPRYQRKTTYVGSDANQAKIAAIEAVLTKKPSRFLQSVLGQLKRGRGLSSKQTAIVGKILAKLDPDSVSLFTEAEGLQEDGHTDVPSSVRAMKTIIEDASQMLAALEQMGDQPLPTWWTNKMAVASDKLNAMRDFLLVPSMTEETDKDRMKCNKPRYIRKGEPGYGKKQKVVKACQDGKEKIIRFGDANLENKSDNPKRKSNFRARHNCDTKKDKLTAGYWSCKDW